MRVSPQLWGEGSEERESPVEIYRGFICISTAQKSQEHQQCREKKHGDGEYRIFVIIPKIH